MKKTLILILVLIFCSGLLCGCSTKKVVGNDKKTGTEGSKAEDKNQNDGARGVLKGQKGKTYKKDKAVYKCDFKGDRKAYKRKPDITVGDKYYATQINDWYENFNKYDGKVVEIEGYYINEFAPFDFIGRYGPSCPYCNGNYVSFEFLWDGDLSKLKNAKDWIKVTGILRRGSLPNKGEFYYLEALKVEKMKKVGKDVVKN